MEWSLLHSTRFEFAKPVNLGPHEVRLRPGGPIAGELKNYSLRLWPEPGVLQWRQDVWNNWVLQAWFAQPASQLTIVNTFRYQPRASNPFNFTVESEALKPPIRLDSNQADSLSPYLALSEECDWVHPWVDWQGDSVSLLLDLNRWVNQNIAYEARPEEGVQTLATTLARGRGSCRDTAWLLALGLRRLGFPSRFVSGYWLQVDSASLELHAWTEVYLPGAGWLGLDPTAGLMVSNQHLALARTPRPEAAAPIRGSHDGPPAPIEFRLRVRRC